VRFGDTRIEGIDELHRALHTWTAGTSATPVILRRGCELSIDIVPVWTS
jgi:hypothetical protein